MHRHELSREDAARILAGSVRNMASAPGPIFHPWHGLDLCVRDRALYRTDTSKSHYERPFAPIVSLDDLLAMSDAEIMRVVTGEQM
jgi:hypothetical protein